MAAGRGVGWSLSVLTVSVCPQQLLPVTGGTPVQILLLKERGCGLTIHGPLKSATFFCLLWLCGCLVLEGGVACLVHGLAGSKYTGQSGAGGRGVGTNCS